MWAFVWCWFASLQYETPCAARVAHPWAPRRTRSRAIAWWRPARHKTRRRWQWARAPSSCRACDRRARWRRGRATAAGGPAARSRRTSGRCPTRPTGPTLTTSPLHCAPAACCRPHYTEPGNWGTAYRQPRVRRCAAGHGAAGVCCLTPSDADWRSDLASAPHFIVYPLISRMWIYSSYADVA